MRGKRREEEGQREEKMKIDRMTMDQRQPLTLMQLEACPVLCRPLTSGVTMAGDAGIRANRKYNAFSLSPEYHRLLFCRRQVAGTLM